MNGFGLQHDMEGLDAWMVVLPGDPLAPIAELLTLTGECAAPGADDSAAFGAPLPDQCGGHYKFAIAPK